jgi:penicillin-binding protein 2
LTLETKMPVECRGGYQYFNRYFHCWRAAGHADLTLAEAIEQSCDVYFYQLGLMLGLDSTLRDAAEMGFDDKTGVDLPGETAPIFPETTVYFDSLYGPRGWTNAVTLNMAIGQGENSQTLINMMRFYALLARDDGRAPTPMLVPQEDGEADFPIVASAANVALLQPPLEMRIAGKTGTAQNSHGLDHGWFIGFAPVDAPEVVVGAIIEFGEHGSSVAPMVTRIIARHLLGPDADRDRPVRWVLPADSAPTPEQLAPDSTLQGVTGR